MDDKKLSLSEILETEEGKKIINNEGKISGWESTKWDNS